MNTIQTLKGKDSLISSDINLIASLLCKKYKVERIIRDNPSKVVFIIEKDEKTDGLVKKYFNGELKVDPIEFSNSLKKLKTQIYNLG